MNIAVFLDEVMPINGPLMLIPKSHKQGVLSAGHDTQTTSYPLWTLDKETVTRLARREGGIVAPTGKPGSVLMFHGNLVHASPPNITPYPRKIVYLTLCACLQPHHQVHPAGMDRAPRFCADRPGRRRCAPGLCATAPRRGRIRLFVMNLHAMLAARAAAGKPVRVGLIGAGKFGSMFLAQVPSIPGLEIAVICRSRSRARQGGLPQRSAGTPARIARTRFAERGRDACRDERVDVVVEATGDAGRPASRTRSRQSRPASTS